MDDDQRQPLLAEMLDFISGTVFPLARKLRVISDIEGLLELASVPSSTSIPPAKRSLCVMSTATVIAAKLWAKDKDCPEFSEWIGIARSQAQFSHGYLAAMSSGHGASISTLGSDARHAENRAMKEQAIAWFKDNRASYSSKDAAAFDIANQVLPVEFSTARKWLKNV